MCSTKSGHAGLGELCNLEGTDGSLDSDTHTSHCHTSHCSHCHTSHSLARTHACTEFHTLGSATTFLWTCRRVAGHGMTAGP